MHFLVGEKGVVSRCHKYFEQHNTAASVILQGTEIYETSLPLTSTVPLIERSYLQFSIFLPKTPLQLTNENFHLPFWFLLLLPTESRSVLWPCTTSEDCGKIPEARCSIYGFCQCPAGHVFSSDVTRCLPEKSYGVACEEAVQCSHMLTGAKCEGKVCSCDTGFTYVRGRCRQLANIDQPCNDVSRLLFSVIICTNLQRPRLYFEGYRLFLRVQP